jgi:Ca2+-binding RTX toxin-like protein
MDTLPAGLTATALSGQGWTCTLSTFICTRDDALAVGSSYPDVTLTVTIAGDAPASLTNQASVAGGGEGADTLKGNDGDDILLAGSSSYDEASNQAALCGIQAEWLRTDLGYAVRVAHLTGATDGGLSGTNRLKPGQTMFDDSSKDKLKGEDDQDWFLLNQAGGSALDSHDRKGAEAATEL